ncbi:uncharacterized protein K452DRAFT_300733 [Aplosporella prunicola CBS 121167]|uniref:ribonuclease T1 n=1 Tax=Aplosporella prunicola CBS 121167 TaxID=1176127 RepID=A0A6A6B568_9PEZI|nr:uncharacterized protein K452DRAFT_300733 [Aplosporella prunicola CBS 121167]KAF2139190.1 hypothetical protein K452DRAFT_300733 [Aplosporella prunicola CBS 121167]
MSGATIYYEPTVCNCDGTDYSQSDINVAASEALRMAKAGKTLGDEKFPHAWNDYEHFNFQHAEAPYLEYPILQGGKPYDGGHAGNDRVILGSIAADFSSAVYCSVTTQNGQSANGFAACKDDSMNPRGKGTLPLGKEGRKLLTRIDL